MRDEANGTLAEMSELSLDSLGHGAAHELFAAELKRVLENILDPNTNAKDKRTICLEFEIKPNEDRNACSMTVYASAKLAAFKGAGSVIYVGRKGGVAVAQTYDAQQMQLGFDADARPKPLAPQATGT